MRIVNEPSPAVKETWVRKTRMPTVRPVMTAQRAPRRPMWNDRLAETLLRGRIVDVVI